MADAWVSFTVKESGLQRVLRAFDRTLGTLNDPRAFFKKTHRILREGETRQFRTEGSYVGERWAELDKAYAARKAKRYPGRGIMVASRRLFRGAIARRSISKHKMSTHSSRDYVRWHMTGTKHMPRRQVLVIAKQDQRRISLEYRRELVASWLGKRGVRW